MQFNIIYTGIYGMEHYSVIKWNKILPSGTTWMGTEGFLLSKVSQTGKDLYHMISYIYIKSEKAKKINDHYNKRETGS